MGRIYRPLRAGDNRHGQRDALMALRAYQHGLRVAEVVDLRSLMSLLRRSMPILNANRTSVEDKVACSWISICSPLASRPSTAAAVPVDYQLTCPCVKLLASTTVPFADNGLTG